MAMHDHGDEVGWWAAHGVSDPFSMCLRYYKAYKKESERYAEA